MPVSIEEVSAETTPDTPNRGGDQPAAAAPSPAAEERRQRELMERLQARAARVKAD